MNITIKYDLKNNRYDYLIMMTIVSVIFCGSIVWCIYSDTNNRFFVFASIILLKLRLIIGSRN